MISLSSKQALGLALFGILTLIFIIDANTPLGISVWVPFIGIVASAIFIRNVKYTYILAVVATTYIIFGYFFGTEALADRRVSLINRLLGGGVIWVVAFIVNQIIESRLQLEAEQRKVNLLNAKLEKEAWVDKGYGEVADILRKTGDVEGVCQKVTSFLAEYLKAQLGALYLFEESQTLRLVGRYALPKDHEKKQFALHEGYVGQAAVQQKVLRLNDLPADYFHISSGTGDSSVGNVILVPIVADNALKGVLELGALKPFSENDETLLTMVSESMASAIMLAQHRMKTIELLEETQRQAEELQAQQEELRVANEELTEQTKALEQAQAEMEKQHSILEESNAELEQHQLRLEESKKALEVLNQDLLNSQKRLNQKARELEAASRYKSEFLANMSHELRTPLNSIILLSQILVDNKPENLSEEQIDFAKTIYSSGNDLLNLINDILDLSKIEAGKVDISVEEVNLGELLDHMAGLFRVSANEKGLDLNLNIKENLSIQTDIRRLEQILKNFISNAIKFTHTGGIKLKLWQVENSSNEMSSQHVAIAVQDTGIGISLEKQKLIFEAFHQADGSTERVYGGTGLGLSIAKELARLLKGKIELISQPGKGSSFILYLPLAITAADDKGHTDARDQEKIQHLQADLGHNIEPKNLSPLESSIYASEHTIEAETLLIDSFEYMDDRHKLSGDRIIQIIEDDAKFAQLLAMQARQQGFQCILSASGESGIKDAQSYLPRGIILDLKLPDISGMGVLENLKKDPKTRHIPVHIISGLEQGRSALYMGAVGYLMKPVNSKSLQQAFQRIEEQHARSVKTVLVVEDDRKQLKSMKAFIEEGGQIEVVGAKDGKEALEQLSNSTFDLMILDIHLPGMSGFEILEAMAANDEMSHPPVIVYTGKRLGPAEEARLRKYVDTIIIKSARSPERLLDEMTLFLHRVVADLPSEKQKLLKELRAKDDLLEGTTILLVDDDVRNVYALSHLLEQRGVTVEIARNGKEALSSLERQPDIDLVLMDIMMPVMDGFQAMEAIRRQEQFSKLPIIALTAKTMRGDLEKCYESGANDYVSKPVDAQRLLSLIKVWLAPRGY